MPTGYGVTPRRTRPKVCRTCGEPPAEGEQISFRGYCPPCGELALGEAARQLQAKRGPHYEQWRRSWVDSMARALRNLD